LNPNINFAETPFYVQHDLGPWNQPLLKENNLTKSYPRRAGISSFGAGGANAHIIVEEFLNPVTISQEMYGEPQLFVLSAKNGKRLKVYVEEFISFLEKAAVAQPEMQSQANDLMEKVIAKLKAIASQAIAVDEIDIDPETGLEDCGFEPVHIMNLIDLINKTFQLEINYHQFSMVTSIAEIAKYLWNEYQDVIATEQDSNFTDTNTETIGDNQLTNLV